MNLPFDKILCLHCTEYTNRYNDTQNLFNRLDISSQVEYWYTCKRPISELCGNKITSLHTSYYDSIKKYNSHVYAGVFNCALEHYTMIKTQYLLGVNNLLIFEDDIQTDLSKDEFDAVIYDIPFDYDFIAFINNVHNDNEIQNLINLTNSMFIKISNAKRLNIQGTGMYALSRKGMKWLISYYDYCFTYSDKFWKDVNCDKFNVYTTTKRFFYTGGESIILSSNKNN